MKYYDRYAFDGLEPNISCISYLYLLTNALFFFFYQENLKRKQEEVEHNSSKKQEELVRQMKRKIEELEDEKRDQVSPVGVMSPVGKN